MAAEVLAAAGAAVTVYERMPSVGRKLLLAGRSGLNITHSEPLDRFLDRYGEHRARLEPAIRAWSPDDLRRWCDGLGQPTFVGSSGRVFPEAWRATPLLRAWLGRLAALGVTVRTRHEWTGWSVDGALCFIDRSGGAPPLTDRPDGGSDRVDRAGGASGAGGDDIDGGGTRPDDAAVPGDAGRLVSVRPAATVLALGGASWPRTGSDGAWRSVVEPTDVRVNPFRPANCGLTIDWTGGFGEANAGRPLKNLRIACGSVSARGEAVVTPAGLESGVIYTVASAARRALDAGGPAHLMLDLLPDRPANEVAARLERRRQGDSLSSHLRRATGLSGVMIGLARQGGPLPDDPPSLAERLKHLRLTVSGTAGIDRAISTAGGIDLDEVDDGWMLRRRPGTFIAGEMLDWDAPTGGYLLQATLSTAVAAAHQAAGRLGLSPGAGR